MPGDFHLDDARFAGSQRAIKDSRWNCRSRWLEITRKLQNRDTDIFRPVQVSGHGWFTDGLRPEHGHSRRGHVHGHGLTADAIVATASDCSRTRTVRDHGEIADADAVTDWTWPRRGCGLATATDRTRTARGYGHRRGHLPGQIAVSPRLFRGLKNLGLPRGNACLVQNQ